MPSVFPLCLQCFRCASNVSVVSPMFPLRLQCFRCASNVSVVPPMFPLCLQCFFFDIQRWRVLHCRGAKGCREVRVRVRVRVKVRVRVRVGVRG